MKFEDLSEGEEPKKEHPVSSDAKKIYKNKEKVDPEKLNNKR